MKRFGRFNSFLNYMYNLHVVVVVVVAVVVVVVVVLFCFFWSLSGIHVWLCHWLRRSEKQLKANWNSSRNFHERVVQMCMWRCSFEF